MPKQAPVWRKIDQELVSAPITLGEQTIQLIAQRRGWQLEMGQPSGQVMGAWVSVQPTAVLVRKGDMEQRTPMIDAGRAAQNALLLIALVVPAFCWLSLFVARKVAARKVAARKGGHNQTQ